MSSPSSTAPDSFLRDVLAIDRTVLANERTVLAYGRTMLALLAAGGTVLHFITAWWALPVGLGCLALGPVLLAVGVWRYRVVRRDLDAARAGLVGRDGGATA